ITSRPWSCAMPFRFRPQFGALLFAAIVCGTVFAQSPSNVPTLSPVAPPGGQRGSSVNPTLSGTNLADPLAVWLSIPARVTLPLSPTTGKDSTKIPIRIDLPPESAVGMHRLRLANAAGLSNLRPFCVDAFPEIQESDENHAPATAQAVTVPCVI